jgi:predicted ATPase/DNA-binding SARP family transcriptional activator/Tfp pilus assembly protein PilF
MVVLSSTGVGARVARFVCGNGMPEQERQDRIAAAKQVALTVAKVVQFEAKRGRLPAHPQHIAGQGSQAPEQSLWGLGLHESGVSRSTVTAPSIAPPAPRWLLRADAIDPPGAGRAAQNPGVRREPPMARRGAGAQAHAKMLHLLQTPHWRASAARHDLPATLPGGIIAFLAFQADWVGRDRLLALLWPEAGTAEAQHSLRTNLLRVRQLLGEWGLPAALEAERRRVRLLLPTDVAELQRALAAAEPDRALALHLRPLLDGMSFPGFPALQEWAELERSILHSRWRETLVRAMDGEDAKPAVVLETARRVLALDPLDDDAMVRLVRAQLALGRAADALSAFEGFSARLHSELGTAPSPALLALTREMPSRSPRPGIGGPAAPARDVFVGRDVELQQLKTMLGQDSTRLVTLLGPGGVGKSRLARAVCAECGPAFRDGTHWIALADLPEVVAVWPRLAAAIGITGPSDATSREPVFKALATSERLIVFDNAEHLGGFDAVLAALISHAPSLRWLVTSRAPLGVAGERVFALEGMACPAADEQAVGVAQARQFDAVRLLESRLLSLNGSFDLAAQLPACLALLRRLGGWPLAIELAAHAIAVQSADTVLADLEQSLDTLASAGVPSGARHASMRASLQSSWRLLLPAQQAALARLSMFRGGFTRAAALEVTQSDGAVFATLLDRLLVQVAGGGRFDLHPLVAQFAAGQLSGRPGARDTAGELHAQHFLRRLLDHGDPRQADWDAAVLDLERDFENFRAAWRWALERSTADPLAAAARAWSMFGNAKGRVNEIIPLIEQALARSSDDARVRAPLLLALSNLRYRSGDLDTAIALAREAVAAARRAGDGFELRASLNSLALPLIQQGGLEEAQSSVDEALELARVDGADDELARLSNSSAMIAKSRGDFDKAAALYQAAISVHRRRGNQRGLALCLNNLGNVFRAQGDLPAAQRHFEESLRICELHGVHASRSFALGNLGFVAYQAGRMEAARLYAERVLAEPAAEPVMRLAAQSLLALTTLAAGDLPAAARAIRGVGSSARGFGSSDVMLASIVIHAKWLVALGRRDDAAAQLSFVIGHAAASAVDRADAQRAHDALALSEAQARDAADRARGLDIDVLMDAVASAGVA